MEQKTSIAIGTGKLQRDLFALQINQTTRQREQNIMKTEEILFADVILALHLPYSYTYRVPKELQSKIMTGQRVAVQLRNRIYSGIVVNLTNIMYSTNIIDNH